MVSVLSCTVCIASTDIPSTCAAIRDMEVSEPVRSTVPTTTEMVPSFSRRQANANLPALQLCGYSLLRRAVRPERVFAYLLQAFQNGDTRPGAMVYGRVSLFQRVFEAKFDGVHRQLLA